MRGDAELAAAMRRLLTEPAGMEYLHLRRGGELCVDADVQLTEEEAVIVTELLGDNA